MADMKCYKFVEDGIIRHIGRSTKVHESCVEIVPEKYAELDAKFKDAPENTYESIYYFDDATETYLPRERTHEEIIGWYVNVVKIGTITLEEVPAEYRAEVEAQRPVSEEEQWAKDLVSEVSEYGY